MLILKGLVDPICTKIVQVSQVLRIKGLGRVVGQKTKTPARMLALLQQYTTMSKGYYILAVIGRQGKNEQWVGCRFSPSTDSNRDHFPQADFAIPIGSR